MAIYIPEESGVMMSQSKRVNGEELMAVKWNEEMPDSPYAREQELLQ